VKTIAREAESRMEAHVTAKKIFTFDAAHFLPGYVGKCANMHGHTYRLEITVSRVNAGSKIESSNEGMIVDFAELACMVKDTILDQVDHKVLNEVFDFRPTSENLASYIYHLLQEKLKCNSLKLEKVALWESEKSCVEVS
jgi:6-pyruvoyltetrahydropterin/6-carboxytetrahydropterin synthase